MVTWIIGLSSAGKTTLARSVAAKLRIHRPNVVLIDGDQVRQLFGNDLGYSVEDRKVNAVRICRICRWLDLQEIDVVCAVLSTFEESLAWNRENLRDYYEVFIRSSWPNLIKRDSRGIYRRAFSGEIKNVVGVDIPFPTPATPDLIVDNDGDESELLQYSDVIVERFLSR